MVATARQLPVTAEDLEGGGDYDAIEVPGDYEAELTDVTDYDNKRTTGWIFHYQVEGLSFKTWLAFSADARWKIIKILEAHGIDLDEGLNDVDPNSLVGDKIGVHVDFERNDDDEIVGKYRELQDFFPLVEAPAPTTRVEDLPILDDVHAEVKAIEAEQQEELEPFNDNDLGAVPAPVI